MLKYIAVGSLISNIVESFVSVSMCVYIYIYIYLYVCLYIQEKDTYTIRGLNGMATMKEREFRVVSPPLSFCLFFLLVIMIASIYQRCARLKNRARWWSHRMCVRATFSVAMDSSLLLFFFLSLIFRQPRSFSYLYL